MRANKARKPRPPLDPGKLDELALAYVGRFATTRSKLRDYLARKVRERGWDGGAAPDLQAIADRFASRGYVDDAAYASAKSRALTARGYGERRVTQALRVAGVEEGDSAQARDIARDGGVEAALRFAERRRIGPFAAERPDPKGRERALSAMIRAGHSFGVARAITAMQPGAEIDVELLAESAGLSQN